MSESNANARLEAFCDGVFAIAITLLVIDIKIPTTINIDSTHEFWNALRHIIPSILAFILSFTIILITWVNHHNYIKQLSKTSTTFIYANGLLLLTVAFIPFPTSLLGEHILSNHATPAVILYDSTLSLQALGWIFITNVALKEQLAKNEKFIQSIRQSRTFSYFAFTLYTLCAVAAIWFPLSIAIITTITWIFWLIWGNRVKHE